MSTSRAAIGLIWLFAQLQLATCQAIASVSAPGDMQIGQTYTISWEGGDASTSSTIYISSAPLSLPVRIGTATGNQFSWTVPSIYPPMEYMFGVSQAVLPLTGIVYGNPVRLSNSPVPTPSTPVEPIPAAPSPIPDTSDPSPSTSTSSSTSPSSTLETITIPAPTQESAAPATQPVTSSLSSGQIADIGVGVAAFVSVIVALAFIFGRKLTKDRSSPQNEAQRTFVGGFVPRGSLTDEPEKGGDGFRTDSSDDDPVSAIPRGRESYEVAGSEPTVGQLRVPVRELSHSMTVRRPEKPVVRAELPAWHELHELP